MLINMSRRTLVSVAALAALGLSSSLAIAGPKFTAKLSLDVQVGNPKQVVAEQFAKRVLEATKGDVEIKVFPNSLLGSESDAAEGIRLGSVQMGVLTSSVLASWVPEVQVLDLPFLLRDDAHAVAVNKPLTAALAGKFEAKGFHLLGFSINGARELMSSFPIVKPEDVKGKKMRVLQSPLHVALWKAVGANPVPIPAPEVYNSMQTKVIDYFDNTASNYLTFKFFEVAPHYTQLDHIYAMGTWVVSETWWKALPEDYKKVISEAAVASQNALPALQQKNDAEALAQTVKLGATIHKVADKAAWRKLMAPVWEEYSVKIPQAKEMISLIGEAK